MSRLNKSETATAGFTLIEVLVALALVAISLSSMVGLMASTGRAVRSTEDFLTVLSTAANVMAAVPDRGQLPGLPGSGGARWRVDVTPYRDPDMKAQDNSVWEPELVVVTVEASGARQFSTIRLRRKDKGKAS